MSTTPLYDVYDCSYGGFSHRCEDYCDDLWSYDFRDNTWMEIYPISIRGERRSDHPNPGKIKLLNFVCITPTHPTSYPPTHPPS